MSDMADRGFESSPAQDCASCVDAAPALSIPMGFRLLTLRCFHKDPDPPAFAWINQRIFRRPDRFGRHGLFFGAAFRPELMEWLIGVVGRPSSRDEGVARRNPDWPRVAWRSAERLWPEGDRTTEWSIETLFAREDLAQAFCERWRERLHA